MKKLVKKQVVNIIAVLLVGSTLLTACSSSEQATKQEIITETTTETVEIAKVEEVVVEPTPEPTPEVITYEGIDMESTLPGRDWINTFEGIVNEPVFVVFNDETNRKEIVENGQKIELEPKKGDTIIVYRAEGFSWNHYEAECVKMMIVRSEYYEFMFEEQLVNGVILVNFQMMIISK